MRNLFSFNERIACANHKSIGEKRAQKDFDEVQIPCAEKLSSKTGRLHSGLYHNPEKAKLRFEKSCQSPLNKRF